MSRRNLTLLIAGIVFCWLCFLRGEQDPYARYTLEGYEKIDRYALDDVPDRELFQGAMRGMVEVLRERGDPHSSFTDETHTRLFLQDIAQEIGGIGVRLRFAGDPPQLEVAGPPVPDKPAALAGILQGDRILAIDGESTDGLTAKDFDEVLNTMRGKPGAALELTLLRDEADEPITVKLIREKITLDSVRGDVLLADQTWQYLLDEDSRIALVRLLSFGAKSVSELEALLPNLQAKGMQGLILDLRGNPGGALDAAVETCELFLPKDKLVVEIRNRTAYRQEFTDRTGPYVDLPLVVLVDRNSASASEIVAGCLQDYDRAVVVGERSFGKGTVQELIHMQGGRTRLKLTMASFWRPSGKNIHRKGDDRKASLATGGDWGVSPDGGYDVEQSDEDYVRWAKGRFLRDVTPLGGPPIINLNEPTEGEAPPEVEAGPLVDLAVDLAVEVLQAELARQ